MISEETLSRSGWLAYAWQVSPAPAVGASCVLKRIFKTRIPALSAASTCAFQNYVKCMILVFIRLSLGEYPKYALLCITTVSQIGVFNRVYFFCFDCLETQTSVLRTCLPFIRSGKNHLARHSERGKKTRQTEEEVGR